MKTYFVTGGAGFIGSAVVRQLMAAENNRIITLDKMTYAADATRLPTDPRHILEKVDICDAATLAALFERYTPEKVLHLAAESHVDRSIDGPADFIRTNVVGTCTLLEAARSYWTAHKDDKPNFTFLHVSTDEVYGSLGVNAPAFTEENAYLPNSPYSASKAASDHLARAWYHTYGMPTLISNCSNNYGPWQFPEKLIPHIMIKALAGDPLPVYGDGQNIRDWLHVDDHARALLLIAESGKPGETYNIGGRAEKKNIDVVQTLCRHLDKMRPNETPYEKQITFVTDRPGHDRRYAIDTTKIERELGWTPEHNFEKGLEDTVAWYLSHEDWWRGILQKGYDAERLGLRKTT